MTAKGTPWKPTDRWTAQAEEQRKGLLAKIHIAKKALGLTQDQYEAILSGLGVESARNLDIRGLEKLVDYMKYLGFRPYRPRKRSSVEQRITALQNRCRQIAAEIPDGDTRLRGLVKAKTGVDALEWLRDTEKLTQIIAIMEKFRHEEDSHGRKDS